MRVVKPYYVYVTFGPCELPDTCLTPTQDKAAIVLAYHAALAELSKLNRTGWTMQHSRIHAYTSRKAAKAGDISFNIGQKGRIA